MKTLILIIASIFQEVQFDKCCTYEYIDNSQCKRWSTHQEYCKKHFVN